MKRYATAFLHQRIHVPTVGEFDRTLDQNKHPGLEMTREDGDCVVACKFKGFAFEIPLSNFADLVLVEEPKKERVKQ